MLTFSFRFFPSILKFLIESAKTPVLPRAIESKRQVDALEQIESVGRFASVAASAGPAGGTGRTRATRPRFRRLRAQLSPNHFSPLHDSTYAWKSSSRRRHNLTIRELGLGKPRTVLVRCGFLVYTSALAPLILHENCWPSSSKNDRRIQKRWILTFFSFALESAIFSFGNELNGEMNSYIFIDYCHGVFTQRVRPVHLTGGV